LYVNLAEPILPLNNLVFEEAISHVSSQLDVDVDEQTKSSDLKKSNGDRSVLIDSINVKEKEGQENEKLEMIVKLMDEFKERITQSIDSTVQKLKTSSQRRDKNSQDGESSENFEKFSRNIFKKIFDQFSNV
jgi:hypothetical protein